MKLMFMTMGVGDQGLAEAQLFKPMRKSIKKVGPDKVILVPSTITKKRAEEFKTIIENFKTKEFPNLAIQISYLSPNTEYDLTKAYHEIRNIFWEEAQKANVDPAECVYDFTRGTKVMSAAMVLAGMSLGIKDVVYISGRRGPTGDVQSGYEDVLQQTTSEVFDGWRLSRAKRALKKGNPVTAIDFLEDVPSSDNVDFVKKMAELYLARLKFHFDKASSLANEIGDKWKSEAELAKDLKENFEHLRNLPKEPKAEVKKKVVPILIAEMIHNCRHMIAHGMEEDALVRLNRLRELLVEFFGLTKGIDFKKPPANSKWNPRDSEGPPTISAFNRFLKNEYGNDPIFKRLQRISRSVVEEDKKKRTTISHLRNSSVLIHAYRASTSTIQNKLTSILKDIESVYCDLYPEGREVLKQLSYDRMIVP